MDEKKAGVGRIVPWIVVGAAILLFAGSFSGMFSGKTEPITRTTFALNTFVAVTIYDSEDETLLDGCMELCREYENRLSKTVETSEVYRLNHRAPGEDRIAVSPETAQVIEKGLEYGRLSGGAFDITIEPAAALWTFSGEDPEPPAAEDLAEAVKKVGYEKVSVEGNEVVFADSETTLDLGGIAKGYIADQIKEYLVERGVASAVINLGGNVLCIGEQPSGQPFFIGLKNPLNKGEASQVLMVSDQSVASSGVYERHFVKDGVNYHHILNPEDGWPYQNGLAAVTIVSDQSVDGDGLSTACFSLGLEKGMELAQSIPGVRAYFFGEDGQIYYSEGAEELLAK